MFGLKKQIEPDESVRILKEEMAYISNQERSTSNFAHSKSGLGDEMHQWTTDIMSEV